MIDEIAHIISTHERPGVAQRLVDSINRQWPESNIYICDDSEDPKLYKGAKNIVAPAYDIGLSAKRNILVEKVEEPYVMLWDDDYIATEDTDLDVFYTLLTELDEVGIVGGEWVRTNGKRDIWFTGDIWVEGPIQRFEPPSKPPERLSKRGKNYRYHTTMYCANWFLADVRTLRTVMWDEELKLQEHTEFFARIAALRGRLGSEKERDQIWRKRYERRSVGNPKPKTDGNGRIKVRANTSFRNPNRLAHVGGQVSGGDWVYVEKDYAEELLENGFVHTHREITETKPFPIPEVDKEIPLGVVLTPDTTCLHMRTQEISRNEDYKENRDRDKFWPVQKQKLGTEEIEWNQWSSYPYGEIDYKLPSQVDTSLSQKYKDYAKN